MASHIGAPSNRRNYHQMKGAGIKSTPATFGKDMEDLFKWYTEAVVEGIVAEVQNCADDAVKTLRSIEQPPESEGGSAKPMKRRVWRRYAQSWDTKVREGINFFHIIIHNRRHYRLTHLLEYGHATRNGTHTRAFEHIKPVDEYVQERLKTNIPIIIRRGY